MAGELQGVYNNIIYPVITKNIDYFLPMYIAILGIVASAGISQYRDRKRQNKLEKRAL